MPETQTDGLRNLLNRFLVHASLGAALLVLFGVVYLLNHLGKYRSEIAALKNAGFPVSVADLETEPTAQQTDATKQFNQLLGPLDSFDTDMYQAYEKLEDKSGKGAIDLFNKLNTAYPTVYPLITEIANADYVGFNLNNKSIGARELLDTEMERLQRIRSCARILDFKAEVLAAQGKPDQALQASMEIFKLCDTFETNPTFMAHLLRCACRGIAIRSAYKILSKHDVAADSRGQLDELLDNFEASDGYRWALISERAVGLSLLKDMGNFQLALNGMTYLDSFEAELEQCDKEAFERDLAFENNIKNKTGPNVSPTETILPAMSSLRIANSRIKSQVRGLRIVNALTRNPESVDKEIDQAYLLSIRVPQPMTIDTMNGQPMQVKLMKDQTGVQWMVYSVGEDLVDDGGSQNEGKDFVVGPEE